MSNILITGDRGFLARYIITELLENTNHDIIGIDNNSKHGNIELPFDNHERYKHYDFNVTNQDYLKYCIGQFKIDVVIANAALIGGIKYFHDKPWDITKVNNDIINSTVGVSIGGNIKQIIMVSSSMVYESSNEFPVYEGLETKIPPPISAYGFQKLQCEYAVKAAKDQYDLDYTIVRPFNAVGAGEEMRPDEPGFAHVIPDFIYKCREGNPVEILGDGNQIRCFTHASDIARGICKCILNDDAINNDFNFTTDEPTMMLELLKMIWNKLRPKQHINVQKTEGYKHDVQKRVGTYKKAKRILGWEPKYNIDGILEEMINETK